MYKSYLFLVITCLFCILHRTNSLTPFQCLKCVSFLKCCISVLVLHDILYILCLQRKGDIYLKNFLLSHMLSIIHIYKCNNLILNYILHIVDEGYSSVSRISCFPRRGYNRMWSHVWVPPTSKLAWTSYSSFDGVAKIRPMNSY